MQKKIIRQILFYFFLLVLWQALAMLKLWPEYVFPAPQKVFSTLFSGLIDSTLLIAIGISLKRIFIGYGVSVVLGGILGLMMGKYKLVDDTLGGLILGLQALPSICWLPLALLWFGLNEKAIIFVVVMGALFSITIAIDSGIRNVPRLYIKAGKNMGARDITLFWEVMLPASLPVIIPGLKQGWAFAWRSLMAGELLFVSMGLGSLLMMGRELNDMSQVIAIMFSIAFISILVDKLVFGQIERNMRRKWGTERNV
jgi:NitT/TauT family transport system permease protein